MQGRAPSPALGNHEIQRFRGFKGRTSPSRGTTPRGSPKDPNLLPPGYHPPSAGGRIRVGRAQQGAPSPPSSDESWAPPRSRQAGRFAPQASQRLPSGPMPGTKGLGDTPGASTCPGTKGLLGMALRLLAAPYSPGSASLPSLYSHNLTVPCSTKYGNWGSWEDLGGGEEGLRRVA